MIALDDALSRLLAACPGQKSEPVPLGQSLGRILSEDLVAVVDRPDHPRAAMDGYALRVADLPGPLSCTRCVYAGQETGAPLASGEAVAVTTGARLPADADGVMRKEYATHEGEQLRTHSDFVAKATPGIDVRDKGEEWRKGEVLVEKGAQVTPSVIAVAAANGMHALGVQALPRVRIASTGDEIRGQGEDCVMDSNGPYLQAQCLMRGVHAQRVPPMPDDPAALRAALQEALDQVDLLVTSGGMSVGGRDQMLACAQKLGAKLLFHQVNIRPGRPIAAATLGKTLWLMLPGSPGAVCMGAELFLSPLLAKLGAHPLYAPAQHPMRALDASGNSARLHWVKLRPQSQPWSATSDRSPNPHHLLAPLHSDGYTVQMPDSVGPTTYVGRAPALIAKLPVCLAITGPSGSGKTTLIRRILEHLCKGSDPHQVVVLKHSHHPVPKEPPHKDTARFLAAGAQTVLFVSGGEFVLRRPQEPWTRQALSQWTAQLDPQPDLILIEGFSGFPGPRIEVLGPKDPRGAKELTPNIHPNALIACIHRDRPAPELEIPCFSSEDVPTIANWILNSGAMA